VNAHCQTAGRAASGLEIEIVESGHLQPLAATCGLSLGMFWSGHLWPINWNGHLWPPASGCEWLQVAASGCALPEMPETWNKQLFLQERPFFSSLEVGQVRFDRASCRPPIV